MSKNAKMIVAAVVVIAVIAAGFFVMKSSQDKKQLETAKSEAMETLETVNLEDYEEDDREKVSDLIQIYTEKLEKAESEEEVTAALSDFEKSLKSIETLTEKLETAKEEAKTKIAEYSTKAYNEDGVKEIEKLQEKYIKKVDKADTEKKVKQALKNFKKAVSAVKTKAQIEAEEAAAKAEEEAAAAAQEQQQSGPSQAATKANAQKYVGADVSALIAAIGSPSSRSYAQSCLGPGQDGVLRYNGFTVYTYKENGKETVQSVE